jgi:hypothetical protein
MTLAGIVVDVKRRHPTRRQAIFRFSLTLFWVLDIQSLLGRIPSVPPPVALVSTLLAVVCTYLAIQQESLAIARAQRARRNFCACCGYDLRATPKQCPECGRLR